ncbi:MAG: hypothetical protein KBB52_06085 [Candidatus Omnitrophica bacterium]|nr:hypothetical protein [Candidatus Omnitrophota bacterium]
MKKLILILVLAITLIVVLKDPIIKLTSTNLTLNSKIAAATDKIEQQFSGFLDNIAGVFKGYKRSRLNVSKLFNDIKSSSAILSPKQIPVKLYLKHGGVISGQLLGQDDKSLTVLWNGEKFVVSKDRVKRFEEVTEKSIEWPYKNDVVVKRTNGLILDGAIVDVKGDDVTMSFSEGGGDLEMTINRRDIDKLLFAPVINDTSRKIEESLKTQFPKMKFYKEGNITLITDSFDTWVKLYKGALSQEYTEIYLKFFKLFKDRKPQNQNFVVVFDDLSNYAEYALTDGVPFWAAIGYFKPTDKVLYLFNAFGQKVEQMVFDIIVGKTGRSLDNIVNSVKENVDQRYHIFIDGQAKGLSDKYWDVYGIYRTNLTERTVSTLRHEFAHELFHNWGLQGVLISMPVIDKAKVAAKKKEFLDAKTWQEKERNLSRLMKMEKEELEGLEMVAANSWLAEGLATYCETDPIGKTNEEWLFLFQQMEKKDAVNPIEFLTAFKKGSFVGLSYEGIINAYAESWALATFLITKYPDQFAEYQKKMAEVRSDQGVDEIDILLKCLGKDLPTLEKEFRDFMKTYDKVEDPDVKAFMELQNVWGDLL